MIDRTIFFDGVRKMFGGLNQAQVDGMNFILDTWEASYDGQDLRWCAYPLATTKWETSSTMQPIEEYGKGSGQPYGKPDPVTEQTYYGRGFVQLTWRDNYARADKELGLKDEASCEWHAENARDPATAAAIMFKGMIEGWFRKSSDGKPHNLPRYFNTTVNDPYTAREIINGDKTYHKDWMSSGDTVGKYIARDHGTFLTALELAYVEAPAPEPDEEEVTVTITVEVDAPPGVRVAIVVNSPEA